MNFLDPVRKPRVILKLLNIAGLDVSDNRIALLLQLED
jgi:hypothetical protein